MYEPLTVVFVFFPIVSLILREVVPCHDSKDCSCIFIYLFRTLHDITLVISGCKERVSLTTDG